MNDLAKQAQDGVVQQIAEPQNNLGIAIKSEIETMLDHARRHPRSLTRARDNILSMATLDPQTANECIYALPRGNKPIRGASIRLAEIIASQYGNCHYGGRVVGIDRLEKVVTAEGVFIDYETGLRVTRQAQRRIADRNDRLLSYDLIVGTGNAAISIAIRNAILSGIPKPVWRAAYDACEEVLVGNAKTIVQRRDETFKAFAAFGVTPEMIFETLEIEGEADLDLEEIKTLRAMYGAIHREEYRAEDYFPQLLGDRKKPGERRTKGAKPDAKGKLENLVDDPKPDAKGKSGDTAPAGGRDKAAEGAGAPEDEKAPDGPESEPDGASDEGTASGETSDADEEEESGEGEGEEEGPDEVTEDDAFAKGKKAKELGMPIRAVPDDIAGKPNLEKAFRKGYAEAEKAAKIAD